jgi:hypothetical protein
MSATEGIRQNLVCDIECGPESCGVKGPSNCRAGEQYVKSRIWCGCCLANCCPACFTSVGKRRCSLK